MRKSKSKRKLAQHKRRIRVGKGRKRAKTIVVNKGVKKKYKLRKTIPKSYSPLSKGLKPSFKKKHLRLKKTIRKRPSFSAVPNISEFNIGIPKTIPDLIDIGIEDLKIGVPGDPGSSDDYKEYVNDKMRLESELERLEKIRRKQAKVYDLARSKKDQADALDSIKAVNYLIEKQQHEFNDARTQAELDNMKRILEKSAREEPEAAELQKKLINMQIRKNTMIKRMQDIDNKLLEADSIKDFRQTQKDLREAEDRFDAFKEQQRKLAQKMHPWGEIKIKSNFKTGKFSFGKFTFN